MSRTRADGIIAPTYCEGETPEMRLTWLLSHVSRRERHQMNQRRAERIAWLRLYNPVVLPIAFRPAA